MAEAARHVVQTTPSLSQEGIEKGSVCIGYACQLSGARIVAGSVRFYFYDRAISAVNGFFRPIASAPFRQVVFCELQGLELMDQDRMMA